MKWVARCKLPTGIELDKDLSPVFNNAKDCIEYIHNNLQVLEFLLQKTQDFFDLNIDGTFRIRFGAFVRAYNLSQSRWVDGFDL